MVFFPMADPSLRNSMPASTGMNPRDLVASFFCHHVERLEAIGIVNIRPVSGLRFALLRPPFPFSGLYHDKSRKTYPAIGSSF